MRPAAFLRSALPGLAVLAAGAAIAPAQSLTTGSIAGSVVDPQGRPAAGATVRAVHEPSGSRYEAVSSAHGRFAILGARVGSYVVTATLPGFRPGVRGGVVVGLGVAAELELELGHVAAVDEVTVSARSSDVLSPARTGAATTIPRLALATLPTIGDRLDDFGRLTPQYAPVAAGPQGGSYVGADGRFNNVTIDGAGFNTFGLSNQPGGRTDVSAVAPEALEEIHVNVAPFDVRQAGFVGAGVNSVTRSGGNRFHGAAYYRFRGDGLVGREAAGQPFAPGAFDVDRWGGWLSGPVVRDRLAFFTSYEDDRRTLPGTTFRANKGGEPVQGNTTRVRAADLDALSAYLWSAFGYETGPYQGYAHHAPATRVLAKLDFGIDDRNKASLRYLHLDSSADELVSNAGDLGFGRRRSSLNGLNFRNSNYQSIENVRSLVGEWRSTLGASGTNVLRAGYTYQDEHREARGTAFPMVDILEQGQTYTTFGLEPFTPSNATRYGTFQLNDDLTLSRGRHAITVGASAERFRSENVFFPGSQGIYVYSSLADFYADAEDYRANPGRTSSPVTLRRFQVRWMNLPGESEPVQRLRLWYTGLFAQDEWQLGPRFALTCGLRIDVPFFDDTGARNAEVEALTFRDGEGRPVRYRTDQLPGAHVLWSPRVGFNWDVGGGRLTRLRGGTASSRAGRPSSGSEPAGQQRRADRVRAAGEHAGAAVRPGHGGVQARGGHGCPGLDVRPVLHRTRVSLPAGLEERPRLRPQAAVGGARHDRGRRHARRERDLLHERQPAPGAGTPRRSGLASTVDPGHAARTRQPHPLEDRERDRVGQRGSWLRLEPRRFSLAVVAPRLPEGRVRVRAFARHDAARRRRVRRLDRQPAGGRPERPGARLLPPRPPSVPGRLAPIRVLETGGDDRVVLPGRT